MVTEKDIKKINIINVNTGILKADTQGYYLDIPMFTKFKNLFVLNKYKELNAPQEFYDNLKENLEDKKELKFYTIRLTDEEVSLTKEEAISEMLVNNIDLLLPELYNYLKNNTLKNTVTYLTSILTNDTPMFTYNINF